MLDIYIVILRAVLPSSVNYFYFPLYFWDANFEVEVLALACLPTDTATVNVKCLLLSRCTVRMLIEPPPP